MNEEEPATSQEDLMIKGEDGNLVLTRLAPPAPFLVPPFDATKLVGRDEALAQLSGLLALHDSQTTDVPPLVLLGMAGVGKTALALTVGHLENVKDNFPDGVLWAALGPDPVIRLVLNEWGRALGVDLLPERDENACHDRLRAVLEYRRVLIIVDDVWEPEHGELLQVAGPRCRILFTTRERPVAQALASEEHILQVDLLSPEAALMLLAQHVPDFIRDNPDAAQQLCRKLEYLPLSFNLAGRLLAGTASGATQRDQLLQELMEDPGARLSMLDSNHRPGLAMEGQPASLWQVLNMSVERLSREEQDRFAMLAVFGGEPLTWEINAVSAVWECTPEQALVTLDHFLDRSLIGLRDNRYWMHALLSDYATETLEERGL